MAFQSNVRPTILVSSEVTWSLFCSGLTMAIITGLLFGFQFLPVELLRNCDHDAFSCNGNYMIINFVLVIANS